MIKQYIKQALRMIGENKLLSVISILGTALAICMIMVIVILYVVNTASFKPEVNRGRTCYITTVMSNGKDDNRRISYSSLGLPLVKECCYPLKGAEAVTAINMDRYRPLTASSMDGLKNRTSYISYTDTAFWKIFQFDFQQGGPFSPAAFTSGIRDAVISESVALALFGTDQVVGREMKLDFIVYNICGVVKDVSRFASKAWAEVWIPYTVRDDGGYQEGINGSYSCCVLLRPGVTREELRTEALRKVEEFNAKTRDVKADILHQPSTQIEEWIGGGSEFGANLFLPLRSLRYHPFHPPAGSGLEPIGHHPVEDAPPDGRAWRTPGFRGHARYHPLASAVREHGLDPARRTAGIGDVVRRHVVAEGLVAGHLAGEDGAFHRDV